MPTLSITTLTLALALSSAQTTPPEAKPGAEVTQPKQAKEQKQDFELRMEERLAKLKSELKVLEAKLEKAEEKTRAKLKTDLEQLRHKKDEAEKKLSDLRSTGASRWEKLRNGLEKAVNELEKGVAEATR